MADRNIALQITIGGVEQSIQSIEELEVAIREATTELKQFTGSPEEREKLVDQLKNANNELKNFKKEIQGVTVEQQVGKFLQLGSLIASTFGAAQTVLAALGVQSEAFAEAQARAQRVLALAFTASEIAKQKDTIKTIANTAAKIGNTLATQGLTAALRVFFGVVKANPLGAFLTVITLVVSAIVAFGKSSKKSAEELDELTKAQENYNVAAQQGAVDTTILYDNVVGLTVAYAQGRVTLEQYTSGINRLLPNLTNINKTTEEGKELLFEYADAQQKLGEIEAKIGAERTILNAAIAAGNKTEEQNSRARLQRLGTDATQFINTIQRIEGIDKQIGIDRQKRLDASTAREKKRIEDIIQANLLRLRTERLIDGANVEILETENTLIKSLEEKLEKLTQTADALDTLRTFTDDYLEILQSSTLENDNFGNTFTTIRKKAEEYYKEVSRGSMTAEKAAMALKKFKDEALATSNEVFSEAKQIQLAEYTKKYDDLYSLLAETKNITPGAGFETFGQQLEQALLDVALLEGRLDLEFDPFVARTPEQKAEARRTAQADLDATQEIYVKWFQETNKAAAGFFIANEEQQENILNKLRELGLESFKQLQTAGNEAIKLENDFKRGAKSIAELNAQIAETSDLAIQGLILTNKELLTLKFDLDFNEIIVSKDKLLRLEEEIASERYDIEKNFQSDVEVLTEQLNDKIPGFAKLSYEAKLVILREFLAKEVQAVDDAETKKQKKQQETLTKFLNGIQAFQAGLQAIQQTVSDYYNFQFDQLEKRNKRIQDNIVGDSKRANELRLEADKAYTAEREKLEKQQAKIALRLSLAQTIANVAQSVAQNLTNPVLAGIIGVAGAAQVAIITRQIQTIDAYQRGGKIRKGQGGLVVGPPHEQGGVKFQGGGIELEGNEAVINRLSTLRYSDILSTLNQAGGGRPIVMNGFDDSRIVEAIAKQRQTPIRAYVVESDITNAQTINKRLELLSQI